MSDKPLLTIAVPTFENYRQLVECLATLTRYVEHPYKIVVVNNGRAKDESGGDFAESLQRLVRHPDLKVINAGENLGWQKAINRAFVEECDTPYFAMMNDDLVFNRHQTFLRDLCLYFKWDEVGAVGPVSNFVMGSQHQSLYWLPEVHTTTLLIGFCMVVRSEAFARVGGLDEGLRGGDDLDLSILLRKEGYKLLVDRGCYVHHIGCQTGPRVESHWNTQAHVDETNNALIRKHGVRAWYECIQAKVDVFQPAYTASDAEGDQIREWIGSRANVVDLGCGSNKTVPQAVGVDRTPAGQMGRAGGQRGQVSVADMIGDATALPFEDGTQDAIVVRHVLEHLIDPIAALEEWSRVLRPGGSIIAACPNHGRYDSMVVDYTHVHAYNEASLRRLFERCGFHVKHSTVIPPGMAVVVEAVKPDGVATRIVHKFKERAAV